MRSSFNQGGAKEEGEFERQLSSQMSTAISEERDESYTKKLLLQFEEGVTKDRPMSQRNKGISTMGLKSMERRHRSYGYSLGFRDRQ